MPIRLSWSVPVLFVLACSHSDPFPTGPLATLGPASSGPDVQLTFNTDQDYWPAWTQDGRGVLYSFVLPGSSASHRCLGIMPPGGGTRNWELCDNRAVRQDSVSSYTAYALDNTGRLLLAEATSHTGFAASSPGHINLWLTDTATPYRRTLLDTLPIAKEDLGSSVTISWLSDLQWTGPNTFVALGQQFASAAVAQPPICTNPIPCIDSTFAQNGTVIAGTIAGTHATLSSIVGTDSAQTYALAENGATVVFTLGNRMFKAPMGGGARVLVTNSVPGSMRGMTCRGETCLVAIAVPPPATAQLVSVSLLTGTSQVVRTTGASLVATPILSPVTNDVIVQVGGIIGHLGTNNFDPTRANLFLYKGIFP